MRLTKALGGFSLGSLGLLSPGAAGLAQEWIAYTSDNFTVYSDAPEPEIAEFVESFELFRRTALTVLALPDQPETQRLPVIVYGDSRDFARIRPQPGVYAFFDPSISGPRMIVGDPDRDWSSLFHEYVHYLLRQHSRQNYPRWYVEGLAMILRRARFTDSTIYVGADPLLSKGLGFDAKVLTVVNPDAGANSPFYITAWWMTHYLILDNAERRQQTMDYLRRFDAGEDPIEAFAASYGVTPTTMNAEIVRNARGRVKGLTLPGIHYAGQLAKRPLTAEEALLLLAQIAMERDELDAAHGYLDAAEELEGDPAHRANLLTKRAIAYLHEERTSEGEELIGQPLVQTSDDPEVLGDLAHYVYDKFVEIRAQRWQGEETAELDRAIEHGRRAVAGDSTNLEAHYYLGLSYEARGELQAAADVLLAGYDLSPAVPCLELSLARVLVKGGQYERASYLLARVSGATHSDETRAKLRAVIEDLEDGEIDLADHEVILPAWQQDLTNDDD